MLPQDIISGALLQCLSSERSLPIPDNSFAPAIEENFQFCHYNPNGLLMIGDGLHHDTTSVLEYLSPPPGSCPSSNSGGTSDEAEPEEHQQLRAIDERKRRRMISNRESARRSRMRKQRHLDELWSHVVRLRTEKGNLVDKLNQFTECHNSVLQENTRLKDEVSSLRQMLSDARIDSPADNTTYPSDLGDSGLDNIIISDY